MDDRAEFANIVLSMLYWKHEQDLKSEKFLKELKKLRIHFEEHVRNIYEIIPDEIPLFLYYDYLKCRTVGDIYVEKYDEDENHEWTFEEVIEDIISQCHDFYGE